MMSPTSFGSTIPFWSTSVGTNVMMLAQVMPRPNPKAARGMIWG